MGIEVEATWADDGIAIRLPDSDDAAAGRPDRAGARRDRGPGDRAGRREPAVRGPLPRERGPRAAAAAAPAGSAHAALAAAAEGARPAAVAVKYASFPIVLETYREVLSDVFDLPALRELLAGIGRGDVRLVEVEIGAASPFAGSLLFDYIATYMYEGDAPLAERRAQALTLDRALLARAAGRR